jgi:aminoglycoside phosphotransferase family enzyme
MKRMLRDGPAEELFTFYRCHRATLRARLVIAHLLEEQPRTPEKWPRLAATYLKLAEKSARRLEVFLRKPGDR